MPQAEVAPAVVLHDWRNRYGDDLHSAAPMMSMRIVIPVAPERPWRASTSARSRANDRPGAPGSQRCCGARRTSARNPPCARTTTNGSSACCTQRASASSVLASRSHEHTARRRGDHARRGPARNRVRHPHVPHRSAVGAVRPRHHLIAAHRPRHCEHREGHRYSPHDDTARPASPLVEREGSDMKRRYAAVEYEHGRSPCGAPCVTRENDRPPRAFHVESQRVIADRSTAETRPTCCETMSPSHRTTPTRGDRRSASEPASEVWSNASDARATRRRVG